MNEADFIAALRAGGVRVSMAESADAFRAVDDLGVMAREEFRLSLRATLVKDASSLPVFDELFPLFFESGDSPAMQNIMDEMEMSPDEARMLVCFFSFVMFTSRSLSREFSPTIMPS